MTQFEVGSRVEVELWTDEVGTVVHKVPGTILAVDSEPIGVSVSVYFDRDVRDIDINAHQLGGNAIPDGHGLYFWFSEPACGRYSAARLTLLNDDSAPVEDEEKSGNKPSQPLERYQVKLVPTYVGRPDVVDPRRLEKTLNSMSEQGYRLRAGTPIVANTALVFERREEER